MTQVQFNTVATADVIRDNKAWEALCKGCKHLAPAVACIGSKELKTYYCSHQAVRKGNYRPGPNPCNGDLFEK